MANCHRTAIRQSVQDPQQFLGKGPGLVEQFGDRLLAQVFSYPEGGAGNGDGHGNRDIGDGDRIAGNPVLLLAIVGRVPARRIRFNSERNLSTSVIVRDVAAGIPALSTIRIT